MKKHGVIILLALVMMLGLGTDMDAKRKKKKLTKAQKKIAKLRKAEKKIEKHMGTHSNWTPTALKSLRKNMTCGQASQVFRGIPCGNGSPFKKVSAGLGTISDYRFYFMNGKLYSVTIGFGPRLFDEKRFTKALLNVLQRKYGPIKDTSNISWKTDDYEHIKLKYNKTHWELEFQFPSFNPGDVNIESLTDASLRAAFKEFLGDSGNCVPAYFQQFKYNMPWEEIKGKFPNMQYDASKTNNSCKVSVQGHPLVAGLELRFDSGLLEHVTAIFHWQIDKNVLKQISYDYMLEKYGKNLNDEAKLKDRASAYVRGCGFINREWSTNRWELKMTLPKKGGFAIKGGPKAPATTAVATAPAAPQAGAVDIVGTWNLVAAKQGNKVAKMDDKKRGLVFSADLGFKMLESGKVVASNHYKIVGNNIFFTAGKGGASTKQLGTIVSRDGNKLVLTFAGNPVQMIFEKG